EWLVAVGGTLLAMAMVYIVLDLPSVGNRQRTQRSFVEYCFGPLVTATGAFTLYWAWSRTLDADPVTARRPARGAAVGPFAIWLLVGLASHRRWRPLTLTAAALSGAAAGIGVWWFAVHPFALPLARGQVFASVGVPLILGIVGASGTLFVGVASSETT